MTAVRSRRAYTLTRAGQSGLSLIEVLIAILVLAFGLLGFALLQTMGVRFTKSAQQRTVATNLAYELVDIMRTQRAHGSFYNGISFASFSSVTVPSGGCARAVDATPDANITRWKCEVRSALPDGAAQVALAPDGIVRVTVRWGDANWDADATKINSSVVVNSRL